MSKVTTTEATIPRVIIVGAGFGGMAAARALAAKPVDVTLIDRRNHHLFQPLLYQVATAALAPADIASPIRHMLRDAKNVSVVMAEVTGVDRTAQTVELNNGQNLSYDYLVLATGARHSYFGRDDWGKDAPGLKSIEDAFAIRRRILGAFERAEAETDAAKREALLTFAVVGAGPTGVELAGAIAELARHALARDFRTITPQCARILLIEAGPRILPAFADGLADRARKQLVDLGVDVRIDARVEDIRAGQIEVAGKRIKAETVLWAAGVKASPAGTWLGVETDRAGRVVVDEHMRPLGEDHVYVVGDTASFTPDGKDRPLPGLAPVAKQMGKHVAGSILADVSGKRPQDGFTYRDWGNMATIGRNRAIADLGWMRLSGFPAWLAWSLAHVAFLTGLRNRLSVASNWIWAYLTWQRGARIIIGSDG